MWVREATFNHSHKTFDMTLKEGASNEINSRWPEYKQRNVALMSGIYGSQYASNMYAGIQVVRDHYHALKAEGATEWRIDQALSDLLDSLTS